MNMRQRLQDAYENVSFNADKTWTETFSLYQKSSLELYLIGKVLKLKLQEKTRPRTVRESIPFSKLAKYFNYEYNESREMSYASSNSNTNLDYQTTSLAPSEPWEMPEVEDLFRWFLITEKRNEEDFSCIENCYESPLMAVNGFEDSILKVQVSQDRVKEVWERHREDWKTNEITVNIHMSLIRNFYVSTNSSDNDRNYEWFRNISITNDFEDLQKLSKKLTQHKESMVAAAPISEVSSEILYSEVLQGLLASKKLSASSKSEQIKTYRRSDPDSGLMQRTVLKSHQVKEAKSLLVSSTSEAEQENLSPTDSRRSSPITRPKMVASTTSAYIQQVYLSSPLLQCQRWVPGTISQLPQTASPLWCSQNDNQYLGYNYNSETSTFRARKKALESSIYPLETNFFFKNSNDRVFNDEQYFDDNQVSACVSEELETQALEQYHSSTDNFYQQLERQAEEQYGSSSD